MKFSIKDSLMENFIFCAVKYKLQTAPSETRKYFIHFICR